MKRITSTSVALLLTTTLVACSTVDDDDGGAVAPLVTVDSTTMTEPSADSTPASATPSATSIVPAEPGGGGTVSEPSEAPEAFEPAEVEDGPEFDAELDLGEIDDLLAELEAQLGEMESGLALDEGDV